MSDTIKVGSELHATRYWEGSRGGDCIQLTLVGDVSTKRGYAQITLKQFREMCEFIEYSVEMTKDAWWHKNKRETKASADCTSAE